MVPNQAHEIPIVSPIHVAGMLYDIVYKLSVFCVNQVYIAMVTVY